MTANIFTPGIQLIGDGILIFGAYLFNLRIQQGGAAVFTIHHGLVWLVIFISWTVTKVIFGMNPRHQLSGARQIFYFFKIAATTILITGGLFFIFHNQNVSLALVAGTVSVTVLLQFGFTLLIRILRSYGIGHSFLISQSEGIARGLTGHGTSDPKLPSVVEKIEKQWSLNEKLIRLDRDIPQELWTFLSDHSPLESIPASRSLVLDTHNPFNIEVITDQPIKYFINLHRVNDVRRINRYFITINLRLVSGGYFFGCAETVNTRYERFFRRMPSLIAGVLYPIDFLWRRIIPKLPILKQFYFMVTKGANRSISKSEIIGRLYFCGFEMVAFMEYRNMLYFLVRKAHAPCTDPDPSYGPLIKLRRVGKNGKIFNLFKLRTMHAYAEYAQGYLYRLHSLQDSGKFKDDFRVTAWGKVLRKMWIDELPQLINWLRGDIKLFGVRALSVHYYSLYPEDVQDLRKQVTPGLVPPYYVDLPKSFDEIVESERKYLTMYLKHPILTDLKYFPKAMVNIIFKGARSG